ncbi:MAG: dihydrodipicolinate synthase family protein [Desulfobacteraceae bacterium]|nr:dihydrodipicolinate synthase family protein [Desulfobacteraceae bacterium]
MKPEELKQKICGVLAVMTTPFKSDYELDTEGAKKHTRFLIDRGIREGMGVLVPTGSTGECPMLREDERKQMIMAVVEETNGDVPIIAGCNHTDTRVVIELAQYAQEVGADGVMISPPYYWKPTEDVILRHYEAIANEIDIGIMVYNNWFASQIDIPVSTLEKLARIPNIVALKENSPIIEKWDEVCNVLGKTIKIVSGNGDLHEPCAGVSGAVGMISGIVNFAPEKVLAIYQAEKNADFLKARELHRELLPIANFYKSEDSARYIVYLKEIMNMLGIPAGPARLPLVPLTAQEKAQVKKVLKQLKFI